MKNRSKKLEKYIEVECRTAFEHVDPWQIMWYGNYLHYFEMVRMEILRKFDLSPHTLVDEGVIAPIINVNVDYKIPAKCDEEILIRGAVKDNPTASLDFLFEICRKSDQFVLAAGSTRQVFIDKKGIMLFYVPESLKVRVNKMIEFFRSEKYPD